MNEREVFEQAIEIRDPKERSAFLDNFCSGNEQLRKRFEELLASHEQASGFLQVPAVDQIPLSNMNQQPPGIEPSEAGWFTQSDAEDSDGKLPNSPDLSFLQPPTKPGSLGQLGHYTIMEVLGRGSFGIVFKAFDEILHRYVAVKAMNPQLASTSPPRKRFLREARSVAALKHENIVQIYSVEERPVPYLAMEFVDGGTLRQKLMDVGPLEVPEILHLGRQMATGLAAAHEKGLIHRDIKPGNILLEAGPDQKVKISDFGLARAADDATMSQTGTISGTPMFMSPEQALGKTLDQRSDLFSLGSVLYQMTSGRPPFRGRSSVSVLKRVVDESPRPIHDILPSAPEWLCNIIDKLQAKNPDERYQTAREVADLLARCQNELNTTGKVTCVGARVEPSSESPKPPPANRFENLRIAAAAGALLTLGLLTATELTGVTNLLPQRASNETKLENRGDTSSNQTQRPYQSTPIGQSPLDKLDPAAIPPEERFDWQPDELVAVIGSHARRGWGFCQSLAFSPDSTQVMTQHSQSFDDVTIWDAATGKRMQSITSNTPEHLHSVFLLPGEKRLVILHTGPYQFFDSSGKILAEGVLQGPDGKPTFFLSKDLCENSQTLIATNTDCSKILSYAIRENTLVFQDEIQRSPGNPANRGFDLPAVATEANRLIFPDNHKLFTCSIQDGKFGPKTELAIPLPNNETLPIAITPNGRSLVLAMLGDRGGAEVWDLATDQPQRKHKIAIGGNFAISPDSKWLAAKWHDTSLYLLEGEEPKQTLVVDDTDNAGQLGQIRFSPDGSKFVLGNFGCGLVRFWDLSASQPVEIQPFNPETAFLVSRTEIALSRSLNSQEGHLQLPRLDIPSGLRERTQTWDITGTKPAPGPLADMKSSGPVFHLGEDRFFQIAIGSEKNPLQLYRLRNSRLKAIGLPFGSPHSIGNISPDRRSTILYSPFQEPKQLECFDLSNDKPQRKWIISLQDCHLDGLAAHNHHRVWFSPDKRWFATQAKGDQGNGNWKLVLWRNTSTVPEVHATLPIERLPLYYDAAFSSDGKRFAHWPDYKAMVLLDLTGEEPRQIAECSDESKMHGERAQFAFSPDNKYLAVGSVRGVCIFDTTSMLPVWDWQSPGFVHWLDWAADGRHLVTHNGNNTVYVLRLSLD